MQVAYANCQQNAEAEKQRVLPDPSQAFRWPPEGQEGCSGVEATKALALFPQLSAVLVRATQAGPHGAPASGV